MRAQTKGLFGAGVKTWDSDIRSAGKKAKKKGLAEGGEENGSGASGKGVSAEDADAAVVMTAEMKEQQQKHNRLLRKAQRQEMAAKKRRRLDDWDEEYDKVLACT